MKSLISKLNDEMDCIKESSVPKLIEQDIYLFKKSAFNQYFAFFYFDTYSDFCEKNQLIQTLLSDYIAEFDTNNTMKKDTILIYVVPVENIDINKKIIMSIEEDKYCFKKAVLYYTQDELNSIRAQVENKSILEFIQREAKDGTQFEKFKNGQNDSYYALLMRLFIKLPYLNLFFDREDLDLLDLQQDIINQLKENHHTLPSYVKNILPIVDLNDYIETKLKEVEIIE